MLYIVLLTTALQYCNNCSLLQVHHAILHTQDLLGQIAALECDALGVPTAQIQSFYCQQSLTMFCFNLPVLIFLQRGKEILRDSWFNKGTAFSQAEKDRLGLRGLIPPRKMEMQQQLDRFLRYFRLKKDSPIDQYATLAALQDRNENLFYKAIIENIKEMAPIVYTPTGTGFCCYATEPHYRCRSWSCVPSL